MVLPEPAAHDASPQAAGWVDEIALSLGLSRAGALVLVDRAHPARLGDLVRTLRHTWPDVEVHAGVESLEQAPAGSVVVLVPRAEDAGWLNMRRERFAERKLKVVLWCDEAVAVALARNAVDFFDWISHRQECPPGPAPFAVNGVRAALEAKWPMVWTGSERREDLEEVLRNAVPSEGPPSWLVASAPYADLVDEMSNDERIVLVRVESARQLQRARWARAEARRASRVILVGRGLDAPGFWPIHDRFEDLNQARSKLAQAGASAPGRLAALLDLEPEAIDLATALLGKGVTPEDLERAMTETMDPGAGLALLAERQRVMPLCERYFLDVQPPVLRGVANKPKGRTAFEAWLRRVPARAANSPSWRREMGIVAAHPVDFYSGLGLEGFRWHAFKDRPPVLQMGLEWSLACTTPSAEQWLQWALIAAALGEGDVAAAWIRRASREGAAGVLGEIIHYLEGTQDPGSLLALAREAVTSAEVERTHRIERELVSLRRRRAWMLAAAAAAAVIGGLMAFMTTPAWLASSLTVLVVVGLLLGALRAQQRMSEVKRASPVPSVIPSFVSQQMGGEDLWRFKLKKLDSLISSESWKEAEAVVRQMIREGSEDLGEHHLLHEYVVRALVSILAGQGRAVEALSVIESRLASSGPDASDDLLILAARTLAGAGRADEAVAALSWLLKGENPQEMATQLLAPAPRKTVPAPADAPLLAALLQRPSSSLAGHPEAHLVLVDALLKQGRYPEALTAAREAVHTFSGQDTPPVRTLRERVTDLQRRLGSSVKMGAP